MLRLRMGVTRAFGLLGLCVALTGCLPQGLAYRIDDRLSFRSPENRSTVRLPIVLDWEIRDFDIVPPGGQVRPDAGYFAVFVDSVPMPPGKDVRWVARDDDSCRIEDGCPDQAYLNTRNVYTTTDTRLVLEQLPRTTERDDVKERHRAVIVLLDAAGRRIGESAFEIVFDVDRSTSS